MKNAVILHGTKNSPQDNWFLWLANELEKVGYYVWVPHLPRADKPNIDRYNKLLLDGSFAYSSETLVIGHSSGSLAALGLLQALPESVKVKSCYLVAAFKDNDTLQWEALDELFLKPYDYAKIKTKAKKFFFIHSDNDPYCPLSHAEYLSEQLDGELIIVPGQKHFSISTASEKYKQFPELISLIVR